MILIVVAEVSLAYNIMCLIIFVVWSFLFVL